MAYKKSYCLEGRIINFNVVFFFFPPLNVYFLSRDHPHEFNMTTREKERLVSYRGDENMHGCVRRFRNFGAFCGEVTSHSLLSILFN